MNCNFLVTFIKSLSQSSIKLCLISSKAYSVDMAKCRGYQLLDIYQKATMFNLIKFSFRAIKIVEHHNGVLSRAKNRLSSER